MASYPILKLESFSPPAWELQRLYQEALFHFKKNDWSLSSIILYYIHQHAPQFHQALFPLGVAQMSLGFWTGAEESFEKLQDLRPWDADVICNLAVIYWKQKKLKHALSYFKFNIKNHPQHLPTKINLASLYVEYQHVSQAIHIYNELVYLHPEHIEFRFNLAACLQKNHHLDAALFHYQILLQKNTQHFDAIYNLACIYWQQQNLKAARFYWEAAQKIKNSPHIQFILESLIHHQDNFLHHQAYVTELFEQYAGHYDHDLKHHLKYQIPNFLSHYLKNKHFHRVLEIGCGTGLTGRVIKNACTYLIGVDLSPKMLEKAQQKNCYDELHHGDAIEFLEKYAQEFDSLFALDVSPYIRHFEKIFSFPTLQELIFSIEISATAPYEFQANGRISYHPAFIQTQAFAQGYQIIHEKKLAARMQGQLFKEVLIYHLKKG